MYGGRMKNRRDWLLGIVGCILFGIGDWLLGYVDPGIVSEQFSVIKAGHGAGYELWKVTVTLLTGAVGIPFLLRGCLGMAELVTDEKRKGIMRVWLSLLPVGWMIIHFTVSVGIYAYSWAMRFATPETARQLALDMIAMMRPAQIIGILFLVPLLLFPIYVFRGMTTLQKSSQFFSPLLWMAVLSAVKFFVPPTPFTNGIDTFCMNAGMIIWFSYLLIHTPPGTKKSTC